MSKVIGGLVKDVKKGDIVVIPTLAAAWVPDSSGDALDGRDEGLCPWDITSAAPARFLSLEAWSVSTPP